MLEVGGLVSAYGRIEALHGVSLHVRTGEVVALVGANGAGKTTLLRAISGVQPIRRGTIRFAGEAIETLPAHRRVARGLAQVPEGRHVFKPLSVLDNLVLGAYRRGKADAAASLEHVFELFPVLKERRHQHAGALSGGQQQMLAMGRALMSRPKLLLLDEPSMGLAPLLVEQVFAVIRRLADEGVTILVVEQNAFAALQAADRGYVLETGCISLAGTGAALIAEPRVREAYLGL
ncbi:ABC transporter ATP-binding protein [Blastochloris viridis]|uniref:Branched-chain amino acid transport ATP-binding protein LivF n=1 Tax=Blastochloris viridis TaxID=1079 RepID=A0A0H5B8F3_BLAVI|nr:ABC transporter ATP-binding protein [Blastochloris viridis]ALK08257.1 High-affinity branched-chain amino acid transport ATP-binding protein LivF [Blastochloris viridis]BAR98477.1 branched-chain amino acid transport ATP-binding protein LivF [Blastochloris viridis]CUU44179.1 LIV-I protein F [Blastochloris viridis]